MTKCHLFVNDFTSQKIRSELLDNKLESEILEWCCPVELCVMMEPEPSFSNKVTTRHRWLWIT